MDSSSEPIDRSTLEENIHGENNEHPRLAGADRHPRSDSNTGAGDHGPGIFPPPDNRNYGDDYHIRRGPHDTEHLPVLRICGYFGLDNFTGRLQLRFSGATVQLANSAGQNISATRCIRCVRQRHHLYLCYSVERDRRGLGRVSHQPERLCREIQQRVRGPSEHRGHRDHHDVIVRTDYHRYQSYFYDFAKSHLIHDNRDEFHRSSCRQPDKRWPDHPSVYRCVDFFHPDRRILRYPAKYWRYWNVVVTNPDGTTATLTGGITIHS